MTQTPGPRRLVGVADDFAKALDELERRAAKNTVALLRRSLGNILVDLRRHYAAYLEELGPQGFDPSRNPIRRPGAYSAAEATAKFRAILLDAQRFLGEEELRQWTAGYERDLREAARLGGELGTQLQTLMGRPPEQVPFAGADPLAVRAAAATTSAYIQGESARFRDQLVQIVGEGASRGWGANRLEISIRQALRGARDPNGITQRLGLEQRAALIARSELANAYTQGTLTRSRQQGYSYVRVLASNDERTCPTCASRNSRVYPIDRVPIPWHPRCVLGETKVSPGLLAAAFRSRYRGNVVAIRLASGERLTVTANHPVLTPTGWVKAERLKLGDQVIGHGLHGDVGVTLESPDLHQVPATAEDVFAALADAGSVSSTSMPVAPLDLHGDGAFIEGNVDVVRAEGLLQGYWESALGEDLSQGKGLEARVRFRPFSTFSHADLALLWHAAAANGSVGRLRETLALFRGSLGHAEEHRIAAAAWRDSVLAQEGRDGVALYPELLGHGLDAAAVHEGLDRSVLVVDGAVAGELDAQRSEVPVDDAPGGAEPLSDLIGVQPGLMQLHQIVGIEINAFHGFVYTFETFSGTYSMGADVRILSQNCRCVAVPVPDEAVQERDPAARATLLDSERWQEEHNRGVEAYAEGRHRERLDGLRRQRDRLKDPDLIDAMDARILRLEQQGPDMVKARLELSQALRTPTASERRLYPRNPKPLAESVPLFG
jgi:SPP1 gp7 family putative phage head morphogenesis protein